MNKKIDFICAIGSCTNKMAAKAADTILGVVCGFIGGGLTVGALLTSRSNALIVESGRLAAAYRDKLDEAQLDAEQYKQLYRGTASCLEYLEAENKKLKETTQVSWNDILLVGGTVSVASSVVSAMMR